VTVTAEAIGGNGHVVDSAVPGTGGSASATASGISTGSGAVVVTAIQHAGNSGDAAFFANGIDGIDSVMSDAVSGQTSGMLELNQSAFGGIGSNTSDGFAGSGGRANSSLVVVDAVAGDLRGTVTATGGAGGRDSSNSPSGVAGDGGAGIVNLQLTGVGQVTATGNATGGAGGSIVNRGTGGAGSDATSSVIASGGSGFASATANATAGAGFTGQSDGIAAATAISNASNSNRATSQSTATGAAATATAEATTAGDAVQSVRTYTNAPATDVGASTVATVLADARIDDFPLTNSFVSGVSVASGSPSDILQSVVLTGNPLSEAQLGDTEAALLYAHMGGRHPTSGPSSGMSIASEVELAFDTTALPQKDLLLALLDPVVQGNGFDELRFQVFEEEIPLFDQTFTNVAFATAFFDDNVLNFGAWMVGVDAILDLRFQLDVLTSGAGDGFYVDYLVGTTAVPIPPAVLLFISGLLAMVGVSRRRRK
jgi:hypothetical protein